MEKSLLISQINFGQDYHDEDDDDDDDDDNDDGDEKAKQLEKSLVIVKFTLVLYHLWSCYHIHEDNV